MGNRKSTRAKNVLGCLILILIGLGCKPKEVSFIPLKQFDHVNTIMHNGKQLVNKRSNYIVHNYKNSPRVIKLIDSVAFIESDKSNQYEQYSVFFYKASKETNIEHLKAYPRDFDRYSESRDLLYSYVWFRGNFTGSRKKYKNGELLNPDSSIRIEY